MVGWKHSLPDVSLSPEAQYEKLDGQDAGWGIVNNICSCYLETSHLYLDKITVSPFDNYSNQ